MNEKEKIEKHPFVAGMLDVINQKLSRIPEITGKNIDISILSAFIEPVDLEKDKYDVVARIDCVSNIEPTNDLQSELKFLFFQEGNSKNNCCAEMYPVSIYNITRNCYLKKHHYNFKMDVILTRMEMDPHDYLDLD